MLLSPFPLTFRETQTDTPVHRMAYDYSRGDRDDLCDHQRDVPWERISLNSVLLLLLVNLGEGSGC